MQEQMKNFRKVITAKLTANLLEKSGVDRVLAMVTFGSNTGYFDIPCDHIYGSVLIKF